MTLIDPMCPSPRTIAAHTGVTLDDAHTTRSWLKELRSLDGSQPVSRYWSRVPRDVAEYLGGFWVDTGGWTGYIQGDGWRLVYRPHRWAFCRKQR